MSGQMIFTAARPPVELPRTGLPERMDAYGISHEKEP